MPMTQNTNISVLFRQTDREEVIHALKSEAFLYPKFRKLTGELRERMIDFLSGTKTLPLTYDPFFKKLFNPDIYPDRLAGFISSILKRKVKIKGILTQEDSQLQGTSLLIMDIIVELEDGSIANVEIQKISYLFPAQRMSCYSADLLLRQYARVKGSKGESFTYNDLKKVYTIIIFENSPAELKREVVKDYYVHFGRTVFDSEIQMDMLQEFYLIPLDVFQKSYYSKAKKELNELNGWLALLSTDDVSRLDELVSDYPQLEGIIADMAGYLDKPQEVVGMFSEALKILDENTVHYMMDEMQKDIDNKNELIEELREQNEAQRQQNEEQNQQINKQDLLIEKLQEQLIEVREQNDKKVAELLEAIKKSQDEIEELRKLVHDQHK